MGECLALTDDGSTMLAWTSLPTENWHHVTTVAQGHDFAVGLTEQGKIVFTGILPEKSPAEIQKELSAWSWSHSYSISNIIVYLLKRF